MSTHCFIGKAYGDKIKAVYCHFDGYLSGVGAMLQEYYCDDNKIDKLISLGSLSVLEKEVEPQDDQKHSFDHPAENVTIAYHRDRGEDMMIHSYHSEQEYINDSYGSVNFCYLWKDNQWFIADMSEDHDYICFDRLP